MVTENVTLKINAKNNTGNAMQSISGRFKNFSKVAAAQFKHLGEAGSLAMEGQIAPAAVAAGEAVDTAFEFNPLTAIIAAGAALALMFKVAVGDAEEYQKAVVNLKAALGTLGPVQKGAVKGLEDFADHIQNVTTMSRESVMSVEAMGASIGHFTGAGLQTATKAAIGFAQAYHINATMAMKLFAQAAQGGTVALSRYGIILPKNATAQQRLNALIAIGTKNFALAKAQTDTLGGAWAQFKNTLSDFMASVGKPVLMGLIGVFKALKVGVLALRVVWNLAFAGIILVSKELWTGLKSDFAWFQSVMNTLAPGWLSSFTGAFVNAFKSIWGYVQKFFGWFEGIMMKAAGFLQKFTGINITSSIKQLQDAMSGGGGSSGPGVMPTANNSIANAAAQKKAAQEAAKTHKAAMEAAKKLAHQKAMEAAKAARLATEHAKLLAREKAAAEKLAQRQASEAAKKQAEAQKKALHEKAVAATKLAKEQALALKHQQAAHAKMIKQQEAAAKKAGAQHGKSSKAGGKSSGTVSGMVNTQYLTGVGIAAKEKAENPQVIQQRQTNQHLKTVVTALNKIHEKLGMTKVSIGAGLSMAGVSA